MILSIEDLLKITGGSLIQGGENALLRGVSTDSRTVSEGDLFIALKGPRFDGHHFALEAFQKKAGGVLVEEDKVGNIRWNGDRSKPVIAVKDTLSALGDIAHDWRRRYGIPLVALTGSNGKTTTKEMVSACLETTFPVLKTKGNLNNLIGVPLTLLGLTDKERVVVLEMGMNVPGEIRRLTEIAEPDVGLITNIQNVHLEGLGNLERLKEEKGELFRRMRRDGTIVVNQDDPRVIELANRYPGQRITFGTEHPAEVMAKEIRLRGAQGTAFTLLLEGEALEIQLPLLGRQFVPDALCAVAVACLFGVEVQQIKAALEHFHPFPMRMEVVPLKGGATLINDAYNASPYSTELALETLAGARGQGRAIAVLGDMLELGSFTKEAHEQIGKKVSDLSIDLLFALGDEASTVVASAVRHGFPTKNARVAGSHLEAVSLLRENIQNGDWILVKGSRRMSMEKIVESLVKGRA